MNLLIFWLYMWSDSCICHYTVHYIINILPKQGSNRV